MPTYHLPEGAYARMRLLDGQEDLIECGAVITANEPEVDEYVGAP